MMLQVYKNEKDDNPVIFGGNFTFAITAGKCFVFLSGEAEKNLGFLDYECKKYTFNVDHTACTVWGSTEQNAE